jgi:transposase
MPAMTMPVAELPTTLAEAHALILAMAEERAAIEAELAKAAGTEKTKGAPRPREEFGAHLERVEIVIEPQVPPGCEGLEKVLIGEDVSKRLDVTPAKFRPIVTRRPKYAYRNRDGVVQAPAPAHLIESGLPTEALLAQIAVAKYADGLPLYRQEAIYARDGVDLDRSLMAQWMGKVGFELQPLADYVLEKIKQGERIFADETTLPTLAPGTGKTEKAWLWANNWRRPSQHHDRLSFLGQRRKVSYFVADGLLTICDENGKPVGKPYRLNDGDEPHTIAGRLTRERWLKESGASDFNRPLNYPSIGVA